MSIAKRLAMRLDRVASFNTVSEHTTLFEDLHDKAAHLAGADAARRHLCTCKQWAQGAQEDFTDTQ